MAGIFHGTDLSEQNLTPTENVLYGGDGNDNLLSTEPAVYADGGRGDDYIGANGPTGVGELYGGGGNDQVFGRQGNDKLYGGDGSDWLVAAAAFVALDGSVGPAETSGNDYMDGGAGTDAVYGFDGNDEIYGGGGDDKGTATVANITTFNTPGAATTIKAGLFGGDGNDSLYGGDGSDLLDGGAGTDRQYGGFQGDTFKFNAITDSLKGAARDVIGDFSRAEVDIIDLSAIDAKSGPAGDQDFKFIGGKAFSDKAGELRFANHKIQGDVTGDGNADFEIGVPSMNKMKGGDFDL